MPAPPATWVAIQSVEGSTDTRRRACTRLTAVGPPTALAHRDHGGRRPRRYALPRHSERRGPDPCDHANTLHTEGQLRGSAHASATSQRVAMQSVEGPTDTRRRARARGTAVGPPRGGGSRGGRRVSTLETRRPGSRGLTPETRSTPTTTRGTAAGRGASAAGVEGAAPLPLDGECPGAASPLPLHGEGVGVVAGVRPPAFAATGMCVSPGAPAPVVPVSAGVVQPP